MRTSYLPSRAALGLILAASSLPVALARDPGVYPAAPGQMPSRNLSVDPKVRNDVLAFWHAVYQASEGYHTRVAWTGNYSGSIGTTSAAFSADVERRINYFRAMCGVPADVSLDKQATVKIDPGDPHKPAASTTKASAAQAAAVMLARNYRPGSTSNPAFSHDPPKSIKGWSTAAWNANANGNLAFGTYGPGAMTDYMVEELTSDSAVSSWNSLVGHRRWILLPEATRFASGDQPGNLPTLAPTNVLYVGQKDSELRKSMAPAFVSYPPPGFFPVPLNSRFWSLSRKGADFSGARVSVTDASGRAVAIKGLRANGNYGHPALIWEVSGSAAERYTYADRTFTVKVTGISGTGVPTNHEYRVTLIHPNRITSDQSLTGSATPKPSGATAYTFTPPPMAEALRITTFRVAPATWVEGAEKKPKPNVIDSTANSYPLLADGSSKNGHAAFSGERSFNLTFPNHYDPAVHGLPSQSFQLNRLILPKSGAKLKFKYRRGFMTKVSQLHAQYSPDGGISWKNLGKPITGISDNQLDLRILSASLPLPKGKQPVFVRFFYTAPPRSSVFTHAANPTMPTGIFIDDIRVENCDWLQPIKSHTLSANAKTFALTRKTAGAPLTPGARWALALSTKLGNRWFPNGPLKILKVAGS